MKWSNNTTLAVILALTALSLAVIVKNRVKLGLDLRGGTRLVYQAKKSKDIRDLKEATKRAREVIERRLSSSPQLGIAEPEVVVQGDDRIAVSIPEIKDPKLAKNIIGKTARLEFRYVKEKAEKGKKAVEESIVTGEHLKDARVAYDNLQNPVVAIDFDKVGARKFAEFTRTHVGDTLAIYLDNQAISQPTVQEPILTGSGQITGNFTVEEAQELAALLKGGALPVPLNLIEERTIGPSLGKVAIQKSLEAGALGVALIFLFMILYYRLPGLVACFALSLYALFTFGLVIKIPVILTLPGIAGLILSLGMAVDANVLIFERLREELREGRTLHAAIDTAFQRAWTAILDSNVTTAITCAVLWRYGTGPIVGFAKTLLLGIACSMFTAITCTRALLHGLLGLHFFQKPRWYGYSEKLPLLVRKQVSFVAMRRRFYLFSLLLFIPCLLALLPPKNWFRSFPPETGLRKGVDFSGGSFLFLDLQKKFTLPSVRKELALLGLKGAQLQQSEPHGLLLRTKGKVSDALETRLTEGLSKRWGKVKILQKDFVGPVMSHDLTKRAFYSIVFSHLLIMVYLAFRFASFRYGICAVLALLHDIGIMAGAFALFGKFFGLEVNSLFVTAALTVVGYSVNDTVVVFDRIRENLKRKRERSLSRVIDTSLQETFARSVNTVFTTLLPLLAMLLFGGESLKNFLLALLIGFISGAYSSIFLASPWLLMFEKRKEAPPIREPILAQAKISNPGPVVEVQPKKGEVAAENQKREKKKKKKKKTQRRR